ncbi:MAG: VWA domain-containing protein [Gemmatimonadaceae bacterium]
MRLSRFLRNRAVRLARQVSTPVLEWRASRAPRVVALVEVQRRLELLLSAMYGRTLRVTSVADAATSTPSASDVVLPPQLGARAGREEAMARFRLLAILQGARIARGTHELPLAADALARDLYLMSEAASVERSIAEQAPRLAPALKALRALELGRRAARDRLNANERVVERLLRAMLACGADETPRPLPASGSPRESHAWAAAMAAEIRRSSGERSSSYRPLRMMSLWGASWSPYRLEAGLLGAGSGADSSSETSRDVRGSQQMERDDSDSKDASSRTEDRRGAMPDVGDANEADRDAPTANAGATSEMRAADPSPHPPPLHPEQSSRRDVVPPAGIQYPEWNDFDHCLVAAGATVSCSVAEGDDDRWAMDTLREHASLVRQLRDRFAPLRARRLRLRRQRSGDELDLEACVAALTDRRMGHAPSDRLYQLVRPTRHSVAILLLVDVSGSTKALVGDGRTVLDVERMTMLLASEALKMLGDPYAMLAFSGSGRHGVSVRTVKGFSEQGDEAVRRRISALVARDNTRLGAAVRHATATLSAQQAQRRILLILSDGKPNDVDWYQGSYAIEDSRRALLDARTSGVHPFCLTVDQEEQDYLPHLFGVNGYRVLHRPEQLPEALLRVVDRLLRG